MNVRPKKLTHYVPFRITPEYWRAVQKAAQALEVTPSAVIRMALRDFLRRASIDPEAPTNVQKPTVR